MKFVHSIADASLLKFILLCLLIQTYIQNPAMNIGMAKLYMLYDSLIDLTLVREPSVCCRSTLTYAIVYHHRYCIDYSILHASKK